MVWLILALVVGVALAGTVIGLVAVPARREGRELLTERAGQAVNAIADRHGSKSDAGSDTEQHA
jgi:hypothetical protein